MQLCSQGGGAGSGHAAVPARERGGRRLQQEGVGAAGDVGVPAGEGAHHQIEGSPHAGPHLQRRLQAARRLLRPRTCAVRCDCWTSTACVTYRTHSQFLFEPHNRKQSVVCGHLVLEFTEETDLEIVCHDLPNLINIHSGIRT